MRQINRGFAFGKLNKIGFRCMDAAVVYCKQWGHQQVEVMHWLFQILQVQDSDLHRILKHFKCDMASITRGLLQALEEMPRGARAPDISSDVEELMERAWVQATL